MNRRWSILSALLATAILFFCMPGLLMQRLASNGRTDDRLKPAASRTMVVWATSWMEEDRQLISSLCAAFEKQKPGLRIYLRRVDAEELYTPDAVLPDVVLHTTGDVLSPEDALLALPQPQEGQELSSGCSQGVQFGIPLWYSPLVFSVPKAWFQLEETTAEKTSLAGKAYFALETPLPEEPAQPIGFADVPWHRLVENGALVSEYGVGLPALMLHCPLNVREELTHLTPEVRKPADNEAAVCTMTTHLAREETHAGLMLQPPCGQKTRYVSLCRDGADAQAFLLYLQSDEAQQAAATSLLMPVMDCGITSNTWQAQLASGGEAFLPSAFGMQEEAMNQFCMQDFCRGEDPVATLLRLR